MASFNRDDPDASEARFESARLLGLDSQVGAAQVQTPPSTAERIERGRSVRKTLPRSSFGYWQPAADRPDPISVLESQADDRVPDLIPIRHGRMAASAFAFFRGAAAVMAADLGAEPSTEIRVQACGDAHLVNFGAYAAPDRKLVFDLNDFDETLPAPFEWDLKRLVASVEVAARDNGFAPADVRAAVTRCVDAYQGAISLLAEMRHIDAWYARVDVDRVMEAVEQFGAPEGKKATAREVRKAMRRTNLKSLEKLTVMEQGRLRIREDLPLIVRYDTEQSEVVRKLVEDALTDYARTLQPDRAELLSRYHLVDFARKVVGVGSVGTETFMALLIGDRDDDPLFLQLKEAKRSVLAPYAGESDYTHEGERVVQGQRLMQGASDSFLGWVKGTGPRRLDYYVRQLRDMKGSAEVETMSPRRLRSYAELCGATLARAHARAGDAASITGYVGVGQGLRDSLADYASAYADQNAIDHVLLLEAIASGRVEATDLGAR